MQVKTIYANPEYITKSDIKEALKVTPNKEALQSNFVANGKILYYIDKNAAPQYIRELSEDLPKE